MKKISLIILLCLAASLSLINAQETGDFKPKSSTFKPKKLNEGSKKVYIANFNINFEVYKEAVDKKKAGGFGRTIKNAAKAKAAIGISTLQKEALQAKADQLYTEFVSDLERNGYTLISADVAGQTNVYDKWKKASGPAVMETDMTGILSVIPSDYTFFYKERTALTNKLNVVPKTSQNLSAELDDALIADVSLVYVFAEVGNDWNITSQAKVKIFVNYRLANTYTVSDEKTSSGLSSLVDKSKQSVALASNVNFTRGKLKIGGSPESQYIGIMKNDLEINGVLKKEKVVAYSTQTQATATSLNPVVMIIGDNYSEKTKWLEPDGVKYAEGLYLAGSKFLKYHLNAAFEK